VVAAGTLGGGHQIRVEGRRDDEEVRGDPVAVGVAVARRQLLAVGGGELPRGAGRDQDLEPGVETENVAHHAAGVELIEHLENVDLPVGARVADLDSVFPLEGAGDVPYDLIPP